MGKYSYRNPTHEPDYYGGIDAMRDNSRLSPQLIGLEGWRVEVVDVDGGKPRRFIVGKSCSRRPRHLELLTVRSIGGEPARMYYVSVRKVEKIR